MRPAATTRGSSDAATLHCVTYAFRIFRDEVWSLLGERKERPVTGDSFESMLAAVVEMKGRSRCQILDGARYEDLAGRSQRLETSRNMNRQPNGSLLVQLTFPCVNPNP